MPIAFGPGYEGDSPLGLMLSEPLMDGEAGTAQTIALMRQLVDEALRDPVFVRLATDIVRGAPAFDDFAEAQALYNWVRANIRFTKDPVTKEKLYPPQELLKIRAGDCDDISMLLGAFLMAVGYPARLVTVGANQNAPDQFSHVYVEGQIGGQWIPMDPARFDSQFGMPPPVVTRKRWWSLVDSSYGDLSGTKIFADTVHVHGLGAYPRFKSIAGMGSYGTVDLGGWDLGDLGDDNIASTGVAVADIIRASQGQQLSPAEAQAIAASQGYNPWASFQTTFTPGAGVPPGGYPTGPSISASGIPTWLLAVMIVAGAFAIGMRR